MQYLKHINLEFTHIKLCSTSDVNLKHKSNLIKYGLLRLFFYLLNMSKISNFSKIKVVEFLIYFSFQRTKTLTVKSKNSFSTIRF